MIKNYVIGIVAIVLFIIAIFRAEMSIHQSGVFVDYVLEFTKDNHKTIERIQNFDHKLDMIDARLDVIEAKINRTGDIGDLPRGKNNGR